MAIGFSPKSHDEIHLEELSAKEFLTIAVVSARKLGWDIGHISELGFMAYTKISMSSWTEEVTVRIEENVAYLKSECTEAS
jgi:rhomboid protease GluP